MKQVIHKHKTQHRWSLFASDARRRNAGDFVAVATTSISPSRDVAVTGHKIFNRVAAASAVALVALTGVATLGVNVRKQASALEGDGSESLTVGDGKIAKLSTTVLPNMTLSLAQDVNLQVKPSAEGQFGRKDLAVNVGTNNTAGYTLTMWANSAKLTRRENRENESYAIDSLTGSVTCTDETLTTCDNFPVNKWGYRINGVDSRFQEVAYSSVANATESQPRLIGETDKSADNSITTVHFGTKLDNRIPTGEYSGVDLTFTATTKIVSYSIDYRKGNSAVSDGDVANLPDQQSGRLETQADTEVTLREGKPTRANYDFKGWCTVEPTTNPQSMTDSCTGNDSWGTPAQVLQPGTQFTITPTMAANVILYAMWDIKTPAITFTFDQGNTTNDNKIGVSKVTVKGKFADGSDSKDVTSNNGKLNLMAGQDYTLTPGFVEGYERASANGITLTTAGVGTLSGDNYTPGENVATINVMSQPRTYSVTIKTAANVSSVQLDGETACTSSTGCTYQRLYGKTVSLTATMATGYQLSRWDVSGPGTVNGTTSFTVGAGDATLTPVAEAAKYTCTKQYQLETATGGWEAAVTDTTEQVAYGSTCSYSVTKTDYKGSADGANGSAATASGTMNSTSGITVTAKLYRNTFTLTVDSSDTNISSASINTTTSPAVHGTNYYRWGQSVAITATAGSNSKFKNWTTSSGGSFANANNASTTYTMPKVNATVKANGEADGMQGMTSCPVSGTNTTQIVDTRNNESYTIGMVNGKCWMLDNLRLGAGTYDSTNTNIESNTVTKTGTGTITLTNVTSGFSKYDTVQINTGSVSTTGSGSNSYTAGKYGVYYNYCAASAGTYCMAGGSGSGNASYDICPKGWRMPTKDEYDGVVSAYGTVAQLTAALHLPFSGYFNNSSAYDQGSYGCFWSSTYYDGNNMYHLYVDGSSKHTNYNYRYRGLSVRCVLK